MCGAGNGVLCGGDGTDTVIDEEYSSTGAAVRHKVLGDLRQRVIYVKSYDFSTKCDAGQALAANDFCWRDAA